MDQQTNLANEPAYELIEKYGQYWLVRARASGRYYICWYDAEPMKTLVGVAGFEPATPASRTYPPAPYPSQYQRLNPTHHDGRDRENISFQGPACKLRAEAGCKSASGIRPPRSERAAGRIKLATAFQSPTDRGDHR